MKGKHLTLAMLLCSTIASCSQAPNESLTCELWYQQPAKVWMESLPIGNGRLGAMIYGGIENDRIALNESSMWSGEPDSNQEQPFGKDKLTQLRKLFFDGKIIEGNQWAGEALHGTPHSFGTHLPVGDLKISFNYPDKQEATAYRRSLNLNEAINKVSYQIGETTYTREYFSTNPDDAIVIRLSANKPEAISFTLGLDLLHEAKVHTEDNQLVFDGQALHPMHGPGGVYFEGRIAIQNESGEVTEDSTSLTVKNATSVTLISDIRTDYKNKEYKNTCKDNVAKILNKDYDEIKRQHIADYAPLFERVSITLGKDTLNQQPTDKRWQRVKDGNTDTGLDALLVQYARYLTIASSRENSPLPIALQGFFNDNLACNMAWTNDYHLDINTEQNYWIANIGNLPECNAPLFTYIKDLSVAGEQTAKTVYGSKGWTAHTTANIWGYTAPSGSIAWGLFPTAGSWMATHLWTQYEYTQDTNFLKNTAYPLLKGNTEFLLDYMTEDPNTGYLVTGPSISPENSFLYKGQNLGASMMPTCDRVLVYEIFQACLQATRILDTDHEFGKQLEEALAKLPPIRLRANGAVREWMEDYEEAQPNHRHTTHLLGFYPYNQITLDQTPELAEGVRKTIEGRLSAERWEDTEWSRSNMICLYARLKDAQKAYESIQDFERKLTRENLFSISPAGIAGAPYDIYAFDGNPAAAAGISEMLIQSHQGYVEFIPCLPEQWKDGSFKGLCIKGGAEVSATWENSNITYASVKATSENCFRIKLPQGKNYKITVNGATQNITADTNGCFPISMRKGDILEIK
jgi:glycoside hydrolase family 95 protein